MPVMRVMEGKTNLSERELTELTVADLQEGFAARTNIGH